MVSTLVLLSLAVSTPQRADGHLPFIEDDFTRARAEARARQVPVFVDVWAPW
jgi:hypothetical protein